MTADTECFTLSIFFSISQVTGMVLAGAKGTTKQQLRNVLYLRDLDDYRISKLMQ